VAVAIDPGCPVGGVRGKVGADELLHRRAGRRLDVADRIRKAVVPEHPVDGPEKRVVLAAAAVGKVVL
jgi:hypothetical protein